MDNNIYARVAGSSFVLYGILIINDPSYYSSKHSRVIDYTGYNIPFGLLLIVSGFIFFFSTFLKRKK